MSLYVAFAVNPNQCGELASPTAFLEGLKRGDDECYAQLVRAQTPSLLAAARRFLPEDEARDAVQEGFIKAFQSISQFRGDASLGTWLHTIVINCCLTKLRKTKRNAEVSIDALLPRFEQNGHRLNVLPGWSLSAESSVERGETRQMVQDFIAQLPDDYRTVLLLRDIEGFDGKETAQMLDISVPAVKVRLHRARQALREQLDPHMVGRC